MPCYHPLKGFPIGFTEAGKVKYKICSYDVDHLEKTRSGAYVAMAQPNPYVPRMDIVDSFVTIPCGQCIGCRLEYSRQWANRLMLEALYHDYAWFVTLTYNDEHVPFSYYDDPDTGEALGALSLRKKDMQLWMKRLRKRFSDQKIRFYLSGEYGDQTFRPHYHAIVFGLELNDLVPAGRSPHGYQYYFSQSLQDTWSYMEDIPPDLRGDNTPLREYVPIGIIKVGKVTWETCAYTARYVMKKLKGKDAEFYERLNIEPEFVLMSRKPGLARQYYDDHPEVMKSEYISICTDKGGKKFRPPRYFDRLFDIDHSDELAEIKAVRKRMAEEAQKLKMEKTNLSYLEMLEVEERNKAAKLKCLKRRL